MRNTRKSKHVGKHKTFFKLSCYIYFLSLLITTKKNEHFIGFIPYRGKNKRQQEHRGWEGSKFNNDVIKSYTVYEK